MTVEAALLTQIRAVPRRSVAIGMTSRGWSSIRHVPAHVFARPGKQAEETHIANSDNGIPAGTTCPARPEWSIPFAAAAAQQLLAQAAAAGQNRAARVVDRDAADPNRMAQMAEQPTQSMHVTIESFTPAPAPSA